MANTAGYEVVAEVTQAVVQQMLLAAWDNGIIPHSTDVAASTFFGPYQLADGVVNIPRTGVSLAMVPADNALRITLSSQIQAEIANPPVPSLRYFNMAADVAVTAPLGTFPGTINVGVILEGLPRDRVRATLTSGDPIGPITTGLIREYVHQCYENGTIPHTITEPGATLGGFTADAFLEIFDDPSDPNNQIVVSQPTAAQVKLLIPVHLRLSNIAAPPGFPPPLSPMGVTAKLSLLCPLELGSGYIKALLTSATADVEDLAPASGSEGSNYTLNKNGAQLFGIDLEAALKNELITRARVLAADIGDIRVDVPTVAQIETFIADQVHAALLARGNISVWTPQTPDSTVTVSNVTPKVLADALAIAINAGPGADANAITNQIPAGRSCAIIIAGWKVLQIIDETIHRPESEGGYGPDFPPKTFHNIDGHDVELNSLSISLVDGAIRLEGDVTVVDAICGADVDGSFTADVGLEWVDNPDGSQTIRPYMIGDPDVDLPDWTWIVSLLLGFILGGLIGGIIVAIVMSVIDDLAEDLGGAVIRDEITGQIRNVGAWPQQLEGIGTVTTRFENPVDIDADGIIFPDAFQVKAIYADTVVASARAQGPYSVAAGATLAFHGAPLAPHTSYEWQFGDGASAAAASATHAYADDGLYVAKFTTVVSQPGGCRTREFAAVRVRNVPPKVDAGPDITIHEGQEVEFIARFTDDEWPDRHEAVFDFGDDSLPVIGVVSESNEPPRAHGTARAKHAYCEDGEYLVTVKVRDEDGGVGVATKHVKVLNVPPSVEVGEDMYAYPCTPITLVAQFTDPGWCDTHTGTWDFGDCTPPQPAIIREQHKPPAGVGIAAAAHVYQRCGVYLATVTVVDNDGGADSDTMVVQVVNVRNRDFEDGFRNCRLGVVANEWEAYVASAGPVPASLAAATPAGVRYEAEEFVVHNGQRSQRLVGEGAFRAGLWQKLGANPGWDYQVTVWYQLDERAGGACRLGLDPSGGTDATSGQIVWSQGVELGRWAQLAVRTTARARAITIFLEVTAERGARACLDEVGLVVTPCPLHVSFPQPVRPLPKEGFSVDWTQERKPGRVGADQASETTGLTQAEA